MAKIFVHLGLPKTATTSLQMDVFSKINDPSFEYIGVCLPRGSKQKSIYDLFLESINTGNNIEKTNLYLKEYNDDLNVLISDEGITTGDWRSKIKNLEKCLKGLDYHLIVTVREPLSAMVSQYVQQYFFLRNENKIFSEIALKHDLMTIYHYRTFFTYLLNHFEQSRISVFQIENIIQGKFDDILSLLSVNQPFELLANNVKKKTSEHIVKESHENVLTYLSVYADKIWLLNKIRSFVPKQYIKRIFGKLLTKEINQRFEVERPNSTEIQIVRERLLDETIWLKDNYGIDYIEDRHQ